MIISDQAIYLLLEVNDRENVISTQVIVKGEFMRFCDPWNDDRRDIATLLLVAHDAGWEVCTIENHQRGVWPFDHRSRIIWLRRMRCTS